ncbi:MAG: AbrB/MazE/SpoVT family DNA-binding domain-containing protein [Lautropia sp.]|nr:AbrB/MazE/SpoVT family DNA-binding domain-containing protein [Lautropia sp.]
MVQTLTSRVFTNGNSQALRIPKEFRLDTQRVSITRTEEGALLIRPLPDSVEERAAKLMAALASFDQLGEDGKEAFIRILEEDRQHQQPDQDRTF